MSERYMLFAGENYYPSGGMDDFQGYCGSVMEAVVGVGAWDWFHVYDTISKVTHTPERYSWSSWQLLEWAKALDDAAANPAVAQEAD